MKTIIIKHQKRTKDGWEPGEGGARFFDVSDKVDTGTLADFFAKVQYAKNSRLAVSVRAVRESPQMLPHVEELFTVMNEFTHEIRNSIDHFREPAKAKAIVEAAQDKFRLWCEEHGIKLDFTPKD